MKYNLIDFNEGLSELEKIFAGINNVKLVFSIQESGPTLKNIRELFIHKNVHFQEKITPNFDKDRSDDSEFINCMFYGVENIGEVIITSHESYITKKSFVIDYKDLLNFIDFYEKKFDTTFFTERDIVFIFPTIKSIAFWSHEGRYLPITRIKPLQIPTDN